MIVYYEFVRMWKEVLVPYFLKYYYYR